MAERPDESSPFQPTNVLTNDAYRRALTTANGIYTNDPQVKSVLGRRRLADLAEPRGEDNFHFINDLHIW